MLARTFHTMCHRAPPYSTQCYIIHVYILDSIDYRKAVRLQDMGASIVANCPGSGGAGAGLLGSHWARSSGDIGAGNMCLDASTVSEELHVAP